MNIMVVYDSEVYPPCECGYGMNLKCLIQVFECLEYPPKHYYLCLLYLLLVCVHGDFQTEDEYCHIQVHRK